MVRAGEAPSSAIASALRLVVHGEVAGTVEVKGWQQLAGSARKQFIAETSDHGSLAIAVP